MATNVINTNVKMGSGATRIYHPYHHFQFRVSVIGDILILEGKKQKCFTGSSSALLSFSFPLFSQHFFSATNAIIF